MEPIDPRELVLAVRQLQLAGHEATQSVAHRLGLGSNDVTALFVLASVDQPLGPVELGHRLGIRSASATVLVDRLVASGHAVRVPHPDDRRRVVVQTTPKSRVVTMETLGPMFQRMAAVVDDMPASERAAVRTFLTAMSTVMTDFAHDLPPTTEAPDR